MPEGSTQVPVEQVIALVSDKNIRTRPEIRVEIPPPSPVPAVLKTASTLTPTSAPVFNTISLKPRLHARGHHHSHSISHVEHNHPSLLHSSVHRSPSPSFFEAHSSDAVSGVSSVRGMVIDHHNLICPSPSTPCTSMSSVGCEAAAPVQTQHEAETHASLEAGADLRRKIMSNLARTSSKKGPTNGRCATTEYFDGIL